MTTQDSQLQTARSTSEAERPELEAPGFFWRIIRLSSFQIGSAMGDILVTSVWNRIMIANFGIPAWPVGLLIAMRYLLSPISLWAGYRSDSFPIRGLHRTPYIWIGRFMMVVSFPFLGLSLGRMADQAGDPWGWVLAAVCFLLYGVGTLVSGSPYLTLVRDSVPKEKQGLAISIVETALIAFFPIAAISFGYWLESYSQPVFWQVVLFTMVVGGFFWFFAIAGVEKPAGMPGREDVAPVSGQFSQTFRRLWADQRTRRFFVFLAIGTLAAWAQDNILEPFGAQVFAMDVGQTTRFNAYWQTMTVVVLVIGAFILRRRRPEQQVRLTKIGLVVMTLGMIMLVLASLGAQQRILELGLVVFGTGFGLYTFGALSLMIVMTTDASAGAYLGLWSVCILVSRGLGIGLGSILRDGFLSLGASFGVAYGLIFALEALGLLAAALLLSRADILSFARDSGRLEVGEAPVMPVDL